MYDGNERRWRLGFEDYPSCSPRQCFSDEFTQTQIAEKYYGRSLNQRGFQYPHAFARIDALRIQIQYDHVWFHVDEWSGKRDGGYSMLSNDAEFRLCLQYRS